MSSLESLANGLVFTRQFLSFVLKVLYIILRDSLLNVLPKRRKELRGEVVLITGSAHGMGRQLAISISELGAKVVLWDINEEKLKEVAEEITQNGGSVFWQVCDVTSETDVNSKAQIVEQKFGEVSILVNNAGIMQNVPILELDSTRIKQTLDVNLLAHFWTIRAFLPNMEKKNHGHIVGISSGAGLVGHINQTDYSASKHGVVGMMEAFSEELRIKKSNIRLTTICPLTVATGLNQNPITRCSWLMPIVSTEDAARQILTAIRREDFIVTIPRGIHWSLCIARLVPRQVLSEFFDFTEYCRVPNSDFLTITTKVDGK